MFKGPAKFVIMGLFDLFWKRRPKQQSGPAGAVVQFDEESVICIRPNGVSERVRWIDLRAVLIQTTDAGPFADDFFWVLLGRDVDTGCVVPSEAAGCDRLLERLQNLPGFDNEAAILASKCTEERSFLCWKKSEEE
jgi:hypothetical protein